MGDAVLVENGRTGEAGMDLGPGVDIHADAVETVLRFERREGTAADAIDIDLPGLADGLGDAHGSLEIEQAGGGLQRQDMGVEQHRPHLIGRIVRTEGPADIGDPGSLGAAATDILGNADAELRVAGVSEHAAEAGDGGSRGAGALAQFGDRQAERCLGIVHENGRNLCHRGGHLRLVSLDAIQHTEALCDG